MIVDPSVLVEFRMVFAPMTKEPQVNALDPMLMVEKPDAIDPEDKAPTLVRLESTTALPSEVDPNTLDPPIWYA